MKGRIDKEFIAYVFHTTMEEKENKEKIILDLCGGTGAWSKLYKEAGYDVRNITLPDYDVRTYKPPENVYGILAAPPCVEFSLAAGKYLKIETQIKD